MNVSNAKYFKYTVRMMTDGLPGYRLKHIVAVDVKLIDFVLFLPRRRAVDRPHLTIQHPRNSDWDLRTDHEDTTVNQRSYIGPDIRLTIE